MSPLEIFSQPVWQTIAWTLLHFLWQGVAIAGALLMVLALVRSPQARYTMALVALVAMLVAPLVTWCYLLPIAATAPANDVTALVNPTPADAATALAPSLVFSLLVASQPYVVLAWLVGVVLLGSRLLVGYLGVRRLRRRAVVIQSTQLPALDRLARRMGIHWQVRAAASDVVREAMVIGLWRPLVLLPAAWLTEMPAATLEAILAHELAHIRRHDLWVNLLQRVTETLLFYHPAVWYVSRVLRVEREKCCDLVAVAITGQRLAYVEALELVAHRRLAASPSVWATAMGGARTMNLLERVRNVLGLRPAASAGQLWPVGVAALLLPVGIWCVTAAISPALSADEGDKPAAEAKKDGEKKEGEKKDGERKEGERKEGERKEGERKEGERREEVRRDGDRRPEGPRDGDRRPDAPRDGEGRRPDGPRDGDRRPDAPRDGDRRPEGPRDGDRRPMGPPEGFRPGMREGGPGIPPDLMRVIAELRMEVMQLRREVNELRGQRGPRPDGPRPDGPRPEGVRREGDRPRPEGERREGDRPRPEGERREGDRPRAEGERREGERERREGDRPRPEGERREGERRE